MTRKRAALGGRPPATSHAEIEAAAFALFAQKGFDATTMEDIATAVGVGRRTLFRYFPSKNDIPWGQFDDSLEHLRNVLNQMPAELTLFEGIQRGIIEFNRLDPSAIPQHRARMTLILRTPALQAHSALKYAQWRAVIADFAAQRLGVPSGSLVPTTIGQASLALAISAYEMWLDDDSLALEELLTQAGQALRTFSGGRT